MTQRIFDKDNKKDMDDLWDILPEKTDKITIEDGRYFLYDKDGFCIADISGIIKINWYDETEITRPMDYHKMVGCVGWFWDNDDEEKVLGILMKYEPETLFPLHKNLNSGYKNFCPAKKSELKFWKKSDDCS